ncbi:hypothetical protein HRQ65_08940 [Tatlockia micdadei]|uniref:hypothetical protein n=1 Tax=Legionella micdadei TaxID=451 RepID=UPI001570B8B5|nr:hypothetical protein [Legionella micdadei]NSL18507.1 hypothetical protein [Legionella micdadei]
MKENPEVIKIPAEHFGSTSLFNYFGDILPLASIAYEWGNILLSQNNFQKYSLEKHSCSLATYLIEEFSLSPRSAIGLSEQLIKKIAFHQGQLDEMILHKSFEGFDTAKLLKLSNQWLQETQIASINWKQMAYVVVTNGVAYAIPGGVAAKLGFYGAYRLLGSFITSSENSLSLDDSNDQVEEQKPHYKRS